MRTSLILAEIGMILVNLFILRERKKNFLQIDISLVLIQIIFYLINLKERNVEGSIHVINDANFFEGYDLR